MSVIAAKPTFAYLSILALLGLGCARVAPNDSRVTGVNNRTSGVTPPACGRVTPRQTPLGTNGNEPDVRNFPWNANLYAEGFPFGGTEIKYMCGATIIQANLLVTAAHCVVFGFELTMTDPKKLFVMTGNVHRDWDSPHNAAESVRKSAVKNIYVNCNHTGVVGRLANDIALIELEEPLPFSETLSPACLDVAGYRKQLLVPGAYGKLAEFGGPGSSDILQTSTLRYISRNQCSRDLAKHSKEGLEWFTKDKFCAGYANGMSAPQYGTGGGLVFKKDDAWYLMGLHSSSISSDDRGPDERSRISLYGKMSHFTEWIQKVISLLQRNESVPSCDDGSSYVDLYERLSSLKDIDDYFLDRNPLLTFFTG